MRACGSLRVRVCVCVCVRVRVREHVRQHVREALSEDFVHNYFCPHVGQSARSVVFIESPVRACKGCGGSVRGGGRTLRKKESVGCGGGPRRAKWTCASSRVETRVQTRVESRG